MIYRIFLSMLILISTLFTASAAKAEQGKTPAACPVSSSVSSPASSLLAQGEGVIQLDGNENKTPLQKALLKAIDSRKKHCQPVPKSVTMEYFEETSPQALGMEQQAEKGGAQPTTKKITGRTVVEFSGPREAGYKSWPAPVIKNNAAAKGASGVAIEGNYNQEIHQAILAQFPDFDQQYTYGQEPRTQTIEEIITITYPETGTGIGTESLGLSTSSPDLVARGGILMGFTYSGPDIHYKIGNTTTFWGLTLWDIWASFSLDWGVGLRLPVDVTVSCSNPLVPGPDSRICTRMAPVNWPAERYTAADVAPENGNEFAARLVFDLQLKAIIAGEDKCPKCGITENQDFSKDFTTPFGEDRSFPIGSRVVNYPWDIGVASADLGVKLEPKLGSTNITANWAVLPGSGVQGSGSLAYNEPYEDVAIGPVTSIGGATASQATVRLDNFRYNFNRFEVKLSVQLKLNAFGYGVFDGITDLTTIDLSRLSNGMYLGAHKQCNASFQCTEISAPYRQIDLTFNIKAK